MRIRREAWRVAQFMAEIEQVLLCQPSLQEGSAIHSGRCVALVINQIAGLAVVAGAEEVIEPDFAHRRERGVGRYMAADVRIVFVCPDYHGCRIPTDQAFDPALYCAVPWIRDFFVRGDRIYIRRIESLRRRNTEVMCPVKQFRQEVSCPVGPCFVHNLIQGLEPLGRFLRIQICLALFFGFQHLLWSKSHNTCSDWLAQSHSSHAFRTRQPFGSLRSGKILSLLIIAYPLLFVVSSGNLKGFRRTTLIDEGACPLS